MIILSCKDIKKGFGEQEVLINASFEIKENEKVAIVGVNGAGKTTLFRVLMGEHLPDGGDIAFKKGAEVAYLGQNPEFAENNNAYDELLTVFADVIAKEEELRRLEVEIAAQSGAGRDTADLLKKYDRLTSDFERNKGYEYKSLVRGVVKGLGFSDEELKLTLASLSGGQKTRIMLAKLLLSEPDLLLLDEPTNHLDIDAVNWLEEYLQKSYKGAVLLISHDRYFIDKLADKVIEIEYGVSKVYHGNYSAFAHQKDLDRQQQVKNYINQQKEIKRQEEIIRRFRSYSQEWSIRRAKTREKMLSKVTRLTMPKDQHTIRIMLEPRRQSGHDVLHAEGLSMAFNEPLFKNVNFDLKRGDVAALIGPNGVGKTTLLNILLGNLRGGGIFRLGMGVRIGYYDQEMEFPDPEKTIFDEIYDAYPDMAQTDIRTALAAFLFVGDDVFKSLGSLSGGERGRVQLCKLMQGHANLLLMDEPTNHLDIFSREVLEEAVRNYTGTVLYVSHDRYFISSTADKIIELNKNGAITYDGGYEYFLEKRVEQDADKSDGVISSAKNDYQQRKESEAAERKRLARIAKIEMEIVRLEAEVAEYDKRLAADEVATNAAAAMAVYAEKEAVEATLNALLVEWEELA
ncbi:MAG: ABC-F family ATP-binding cassette domain-containing protein [Defluviitaleaceae bacterium]|nr:ABC-F family ATP-binding cassette domain-containing protein [Defluviitaleaceae bacterium]